MGSSVQDLAYIHARVRAMISTLLTPQDLNEMVQAPDYEALLGCSGAPSTAPTWPGWTRKS